MAHYFRIWSVTLLVMLLATAAVNYWADPYGLYRDYGDGEWKPHAATQGALIKPYRVLEAKAQVLVLGNSRAEVGFDPDDPAWPEEFKPVYNLALPGTATRTTRRLFEHALTAHPPQAILLGVDFMDFLLPRNARGRDPAEVRRMLSSGDVPQRWLTRLHDAAATLASLDALIHSLDTLRSKGRHGIPHLTLAGFNPMHDYQVLARNEGYFALFRQRDAENLRAYRQRPANIHTKGTGSSPAFEDIRAILDNARAHGIQVWVVIYPYHAHLLEIFRIAGLWPLFEDWKRELTHLVALSGRGHAVLWDFSGHHVYAREAVPVPADRATEVRWYWEAGHFKKELGHIVLRSILEPGQQGPGAILTPGNIESHLDHLRQAAESYQRDLPALVRELEKLAN
ncbi:MAG TPA: hypothetical protein PLW81_07055 [Thiobacillaceae bacterium]|nr:hypothetical protein [Thiobacillaceae bacterium]